MILDACSRINRELLPQDRDTTRHKGRKNSPAGREWGVTELVLVLYDQQVAAAYEKLHHASIEVRYDDGLRTPVARTREWLSVIQEADDTGLLTCSK